MRRAFGDTGPSEPVVVDGAEARVYPGTLGRPMKTPPPPAPLSIHVRSRALRERDREARREPSEASPRHACRAAR